MNLLIDTHVLIWFLTDDDRLPEKVKQTIESNENSCYTSIASYWEIAIKHSLGRLELFTDLENLFQIIEDSGFEPLPINKKHIIENASLEFHHQDPFDRLLIAQAIIEELSIVSKDKQFKKYKPTIIWDI